MHHVFQIDHLFGIVFRNRLGKGQAAARTTTTAHTSMWIESMNENISWFVHRFLFLFLNCASQECSLSRKARRDVSSPR